MDENNHMDKICSHEVNYLWALMTVLHKKYISIEIYSGCIMDTETLMISVPIKTSRNFTYFSIRNILWQFVKVEYETKLNKRNLLTIRQMEKQNLR